MNFTILGPSDGQLNDSKSDMVDGRFGGNRKVSSNQGKEKFFIDSEYITVSGGATISGVEIPGEGFYPVYGYSREDLPYYLKSTFNEEKYNLFNVLVASGVVNEIETGQVGFDGTGNYLVVHGHAPNKKENPVDETIRDVDDMVGASEKKNEFSYQEEKINVQKGNEAGWQTKSDPDNRPRMNEGSDAVQVPEVVEERQRKKANPWQYDTSSTYEGELS
jgi:hypothetical protein